MKLNKFYADANGNIHTIKGAPCGENTSWYLNGEEFCCVVETSLITDAIYYMVKESQGFGSYKTTYTLAEVPSRLKKVYSKLLICIEHDLLRQACQREQFRIDNKISVLEFNHLCDYFWQRKHEK